LAVLHVVVFGRRVKHHGLNRPIARGNVVEYSSVIPMIGVNNLSRGNRLTPPANHIHAPVIPEIRRCLESRVNDIGVLFADRIVRPELERPAVAALHSRRAVYRVLVAGDVHRAEGNKEVSHLSPSISGKFWLSVDKFNLFASWMIKPTHQNQCSALHLGRDRIEYLRDTCNVNTDIARVRLGDERIFYILSIPGHERSRWVARIGSIVHDQANAYPKRHMIGVINSKGAATENSRAQRI
jgi:hypothetical protein